MNRREVITLFGASAICSSTPVLAADDHSAHMHHGAASSAAKPNARLIELASTCIKEGQACLAHCYESFASGDTSLVACARSVDQMLSVCATLQKLASAGSPHIGTMAKVALGICVECEKECRKHADHHATCKACAEACLACADECRKS